MRDANHPKDPVHVVISESLRQTEDEISLACDRKQLSVFDVNPPPQIVWEEVPVRRTVDRRTGLSLLREVYMPWLNMSRLDN